MSKLEHTPGPWIIEGQMLPTPMSAVTVYADGVWIASVNGDHTSNSSRPVRGFPSNDEGNANARLIAAAPELLKACLKIKAEIDEGFHASETQFEWIRKIVDEDINPALAKKGE